MFDVWYFTLNKNLRKHKTFDSITEITKWCKRNKEKIKIHSGSWQVLEIMKSI